MKIILNTTILILVAHAVLFSILPQYNNFIYGFCYGDYSSLLWNPITNKSFWETVLSIAIFRASFAFMTK